MKVHERLFDKPFDALPCVFMMILSLRMGHDALSRTAVRGYGPSQ